MPDSGTTYVVEYEQDLPALEFDDPDECLSFARTLHSSTDAYHPIGAHFTRPNNESLLAVLGSDVSFLVYYPAGYSETATGSLSSGADVSIPAPIDYWFCGSHGQISVNHAVQASTMLDALASFLTHGGTPRCIAWRTD